jgi:protein-arginine kinase activator protein McsA
MKRFKIGDKVIALNNPPDNNCQPRVKGNTYIVEAIMYCSGCGEQQINIGSSSSKNNMKCTCGEVVLNKGLKWTHSYLFTKINDLDIAIEEAVENEDYEMAVILRDLKILA